MSAAAAGRQGLEVHEHCYITGPYANNSARYKFSHSHEGGDVPHEHNDGTSRTGCAARTIDKDEWYAATGLRGGGRKRFTAKPTGVQLPIVPTAAPTFEIIIVGDGGASIAKGATGGALDATARMQLALGAQVTRVTHVGPGLARGAR